MEEIKNKSIGVMDSGVGGLTVLKELKILCPNENYIYFGDTKNLPYGEKTKQELIALAKKVFDFYAKKNVKAVVMACNTTSATVYDELKDNYDFKIYPIIQVVANCITKDSNLNRIAIMATNATVNSKKYSQELQKNKIDLKVFEQACPKWVPIVEKKLTNYDEKKVITEYLKEVLAFNPQKIILGCTHYPYLLNKLEKYAPKELFINPAKIFANYIKDDLKSQNLLCKENSGETEYYASANPKEFRENARIFLNIEKEAKLVVL